MQAILNIDEIMSVAAAGLYRLNPCWIYPDNQYYPKDASKLAYNIHDPARAKALLKEAGYNGEEIVMLATAAYTYMRDVAVVSFAPPDEVIEDAFARLGAATTVEERAAAWWTVEQRVNAQVIELKIGDLGIRQASSARLRNFAPFDALGLWNDWLA